METTLENIANEFALRKNEGEQNRLRYLMYGRIALRELNLTIEENVKSIMLDLDAMNSIVLPDDFLKVYKLGYCVNGRILELDRDDSICGYEKKDNYYKIGCPTEEGTGTLYNILVKSAEPIEFTYTKNIENPNAESITVYHNIQQYPALNVCSYTIPVTDADGEYEVTELGTCTDVDPSGFSNNDCGCDEEVTDEQRICNDCNCLLSGQDLTWYGEAGSWNNIYYNGRSMSMPSYPAYVSKGFYEIKGNRLYVHSVCSGDAGKLVLEYKSNGIEAGETTYLPAELSEYIVAHIRYSNEMDKGGRMIAVFKDELRRQYNIYKNFKIRIYLKDAVKSRRKNISQTHLGR